MATVAQIFETMEYGPAPESDNVVREWLTRHNGGFGHFVGGKWTRPGSRAESFDVINPATGKLLARMAQGTTRDVDAAVGAARAAFGPWSALSGHARARHLYALARAVQKHARFLSVLESMDNGKSIRETRDIDIPLVARHFYHHAGWAQLLESEFPGYGALGVVGQIIPWNFPLLMLAWKVAPALAAGNTVVMKPAEFTPLTALAFAEIAQEAGLPPGVFNIVNGDGTTGAALVDHPGVDKIAFTGSTEVGRIIRKATAGSGKKLSLELGGKSPFIVFEDADLDSVVEGVVDAIWFNQGQVCCAGSRLLAQEGIAERLTTKLRARMEKLRIGSPLDKAVDMGAIVAPVQLERIRGLVEQGVTEGATMWQPSWACPTEGSFYPPTLFTNVSPAATIAQVEIFGPVLVSMTFRTPTEAVQLANNTPYGLASSVWTENINLALDIAPKIKAGVVWINSTNLFDAAAGFGGYRESGFGREGGREGMYEYLKPQSSVVKPQSSVVGRQSSASQSLVVSRESLDHPLERAAPNAVTLNDAAPNDAAPNDAAPNDAAPNDATPNDAAPNVVTSGARGAPPENQNTIAVDENGHRSAAPDIESADEDADDRRLTTDDFSMPALDRTPKLFIGGKQARPDSGYSRRVRAPDGRNIGEVGDGNRKDIRNAVEAAHAASAWSRTTAHNRAQILYYIAENLATRGDELARRIDEMTGRGPESARAEVDASISRLFTYAAWADKYDGAVHSVPIRGVALAMNEPIGVIGIAASEAWPLLGLVSLLAPALAVGNTVVAVPSESHPLAATDFYSVLETSDVPAGVVNIVTGPKDALARVLAEHDDVDAVWYSGSAAGAKAVELASASNMKRTWVETEPRDWLDVRAGEGREFLREATQVKNIWIPYGE